MFNCHDSERVNPLLLVNNPLLLVKNSLLLVKNPLLLVKNPLLLVKNPLLLVKNPLLLVNNPLLLVKNPLLLVPGKAHHFTDPRKGESVPAWEGTGTRRRVAKSSQGAAAGRSSMARASCSMNSLGGNFTGNIRKYSGVVFTNVYICLL